MLKWLGEFHVFDGRREWMWRTGPSSWSSIAPTWVALILFVSALTGIGLFMWWVNGPMCQ